MVRWGMANVLGISLSLRLAMIAYGEWHDDIFRSLPYTDVDYAVFTDAARHLTLGSSPFQRPTYRYSPLLALLLAPNVLVHRCWGKLLFSVADVLIGALIHRIGIARAQRRRALRHACLWLLNPLSIVISTRGSCDSLVSLLVVSSLYLALQVREGRQGHLRAALSGALLGLSVHLKLYPVVFVPSFAIFLGAPGPGAPQDGKKGIAHDGLLSRARRMLRSGMLWVFLAGVVIAGGLATAISFAACGAAYVDEALLYHVTRADHRHNFAPHFYWVYLAFDEPARRTAMVAVFVPQVLVLLGMSLAFAETALPATLFLQTLFFVASNKVCTAQYFVWFVTLAPLALPDLRFSGGGQEVGGLALGWLGAAALWLYEAHALEMRGLSRHARVWLASIAFFGASMAAVLRCVRALQAAAPREERAQRRCGRGREQSRTATK